MENPTPLPVVSELEYRSGGALPNSALVTLIGWWCAGVGAYWIAQISIVFSRQTPWRYFWPWASPSWNFIVENALQFAGFVLSAGLTVAATGLICRQRVLTRLVFPMLALLSAVILLIVVRSSMRNMYLYSHQMLIYVVLQNMWEIAPLAILLSLLMCRSVRDAMKTPL